ncbi:MAG: hypothetical protein KDA66_00690 [Planctomycetaceae bacterium]|nr:hypothetical protein [Planctomycetaceae bacterium]
MPTADVPQAVSGTSGHVTEPDVLARGDFFWQRILLQWLVLSGLLFTWSLMRVPVPGVNEPHYLTKARHYWDPQWAASPPNAEWPAGDVFLDSSNPHLFFYSTFGYLTHVLSLHDAAIAGRLLGLAVVAAGWIQFCRGLKFAGSTGASRSVAPTWSELLVPLAIFLMIHAAGNWSGEWLVGGIESKVPAYGLLLAGIGCFLMSQQHRGAVLCGLATSFHPLVGGWGTICIGMVLTHNWIFDASSRPGIKRCLVSLGLFLAAAAVGTIPALQLVVSSDPAAGAGADYLMVAYRLSHHLDPMTFPTANWRGFITLLVVWVLLRFARTATKTEWQWERIVLASLLVAAVGVVVAWGPRPLKTLAFSGLRVKLLKFYPFRLADVLVPIAVAFEIAAYLSKFPPTFGSRVSAGMRKPTLITGALSLILVTAFVPGSDQNPSDMNATRRADWIATCEWVRENTPQDAVLYATNERWAVKWFAQRSEYVNYKDCPQDAASIMDWNRRQWDVSDWQAMAFQDWRVTPEELQALHEETGITHLIVSRMGPFLVDPVFEQGDFKVYVIGASDSE